MARRSRTLVAIVPMLLALLPALSLTSSVAAATDTICGRVDAVTGTTATIDGVDVGITNLGTDAVAGLHLALNAGTSACVDVSVEAGQTQDATSVDVSLSDLCGNVDPAPGSDVLIDRVLIPPDLVSTDVLGALQWSINQNASACFSASVSGGGSTTEVDVSLDLSLCSTVTALADDTVTLSGMRFAVARDVDLQASVGEVLCVVISTADDGTLQVIAVDDEDDGSAPTPIPSVGGVAPPDTEMSQPVAEAPALLAGLLLLASAVAASRRFQRSVRVR